VGHPGGGGHQEASVADQRGGLLGGPADRQGELPAAPEDPDALECRADGRELTDAGQESGGGDDPAAWQENRTGRGFGSADAQLAESPGNFPEAQGGGAGLDATGSPGENQVSQGPAAGGMGSTLFALCR